MRGAGVTARACCSQRLGPELGTRNARKFLDCLLTTTSPCLLQTVAMGKPGDGGGGGNMDMGAAMQFGLMNALRTGNPLYDLIMCTVIPSIMVTSVPAREMTHVLAVAAHGGDDDQPSPPMVRHLRKGLPPADSRVSFTAVIPLLSHRRLH